MRLLNPPSMFFSSILYKVVMHLLQGRVRVGLLPCAALMLTIDYSPETRKEQQQHHGAPYKVATNPAAEPACRWKIMCMDGLLCAGKRSSGFMPVVPAWTEDRMQNAPPLPSASSKTISLQQGGGTIVFQLQPTALAFGIHYRNRQSQRLHGRIQRNLPSRESGLCHPLDIHSAPQLGSAAHRVTC